MRRLLFVLAVLCVARAQEDASVSLVKQLVGDVGVLAVRDMEHVQSDPKRKAFFPKDAAHPLVRAALDDPLGTPARAERNARDVLAAPGLAATLLALKPYRSFPTGSEGDGPGLPDAEKLPPAIRPAVHDLYLFSRAAAHMVELALGKLSEEERAYLRENLPRFITRTTRESRERALSGKEDVEGRELLQRCAALCARIDQPRLRHAAGVLALAAEQAAAKLQGKPFEPKELRIDTPLGPVVLRGARKGGGGADAFILIDFAGDDEHRLPDTPVHRPVRVVIDLSGDDLYLSTAHHSWASAVLGVSVLIDAGGHDDYRGADWSLACGLAGVGILWDKAGNDRYYGGLGTLGTGIFGAGVLIDDAGDDEYAGGAFTEGFASTEGFGALIDRAGNDTYFAGRDDPDIWRRKGTFVTFAQGSAFGHRFGHVYDDNGKRRWKMTGQLPGGIGLLIDGGGHDKYQADVFGQGSAYWYSLGLLVDAGGNDSYRTTWYGQGVGTHVAVGCVVDLAGDDFYFSRNTSQGCGHDFSVGILHDRAGNDRYVGLALCQGAGNAFRSLGLLVDERGDDTYRCGRRSWGFGSTEKAKPGWSPYGIFLDLAGTDRYEGRDRPERDAKGRWKQGARGFGWAKR